MLENKDYSVCKLVYRKSTYYWDLRM